MGALDGVRVLELGQVVAAPFCGCLLGDFGADVIKVEMPGAGDNLRKMGPLVDGRSLWFMVENRNKRSVTLNLKTERGREILCELIRTADVVTENFKPGILEKLGFSWDRIHALNPRAVFVRISGYGQTGPYKDRAGYDRIGLGMGGLTYITGDEDRSPLRPGVSLADYLTGYAAAMGVVNALYHRDVHGYGKGQEIDIGLYEPVFRILEWTPMDYHLTGTVRERIGNAFPGTAPSGHFQTKDGKWMSLAVGNDRLFERFARCVGRPDLTTQPEFRTNELRVRNRAVLDRIAEDWITCRTAEECFAVLGDEIPVGPIHSIREIFEDPHYAARQNIVDVEDRQWGRLKVQGPVPKLSATPGEVRTTGPELGQHNHEIYGGLLHYTDEEIAQLLRDGVI